MDFVTDHEVLQIFVSELRRKCSKTIWDSSCRCWWCFLKLSIEQTSSTQQQYFSSSIKSRELNSENRMTQNCCFDMFFAFIDCYKNIAWDLRTRYLRAGVRISRSNSFRSRFWSDNYPVPAIEVSGNFPHYIAKFGAQTYLPVRLKK